VPKAAFKAEFDLSSKHAKTLTKTEDLERLMLELKAPSDST